MKTPHFSRIALVLAVNALMASQSAKAETYTIFNNAGTFAWDVAPWSNGSPAGSNIGLLQGGGTVTVDGSTPDWTTDALLVGWSGDANLAISGGNLTVGDFGGLGLSVGESGIGAVTQTGGVVTATAVRFNRAGGTGTYNLNGGTLAAGYVNRAGGGAATLNFNGGTLQATAGGANWFGDGGITVFVNSGGATIDTQAFDVGFTNNLFDGGGGGLTKNGTGTLTLDNVANSYTGATVVNAGTLVFKSDTVTSSISVSNNATVVYDSSVIRTVVGISGAGNAEFKGVQGGFYSLGVALTHSGTTTINMTPGTEPFYGTLFAQSANVLSANSVLNVLSGKLDLRADQTIAGLTGSGGYVTTDGGSAATLTINTATGQNYTYSGVVGATPDPYNAATIAITKTGEGTQVLSGVNTYTGETVIKAGTLKLNTSTTIASSSQITVGDTGSSGAILDVATAGLTVSSSQTLAGIGTVLATGNTVTIDGTIAPGNSIGTLTIDGGTLALTGTSMLVFELGTTSDLISLLNLATLNLGSGTLGLADFTFSDSGGFGAGTYTLIGGAASYAGTLDTDDLSGTVLGYSSTLSMSGNDLVLNVIPEPRAALLGTLGLLALLRRRRA